MSSESEQQQSHHRRDRRSKLSRSRSREAENKIHNQNNHHRRLSIKIPDLNSPLASYKHFSLIQNHQISLDLLEKSYNTYKIDWEKQQNQRFLRQYKKDAWFSEKYDPEVLDLLQKDRKQNSRRCYDQFITKLQQGAYDRINLQVKQPLQLGVLQRIDEVQETSFNLGFIINHTLDVHLNQHLDITGFPYFGFDQDNNTLFIKSVPRSISRYDIRSIVENLTGYKYLTMSDPVKKMNLTRFCWIQFDSQENCNKAQLILSGLIVKNQTLVVSRSNTKVKRVKIIKNYPAQRAQQDIQIITRLINTLDSQIAILNNPLFYHHFNTSSLKLDILLLYLRKVHAYDYFTSTMYENQRILSLKVGSAFLRMETSSWDDNQIFKQIKRKSQERIAKGSDTPDYIGLLRQQVEDYIRQREKIDKYEVKEMWKCIQCDKKFKACDFLSKHIINKHEEIKFKTIQTIMKKLYLNDPFKITFSSLMDKDQKYRRPFNRNESKPYHKLKDDKKVRQSPKEMKGKEQSKNLINFLDI